MIYEAISAKIKSLDETAHQVQSWRENGETIVWTNGCFDLLHLGHVKYLCASADLGDRLIIGMNSDISVGKLKGSDRPVLDQETRSVKLAAMQFADVITIYDEPTPLSCILVIKPDILVKGGDYDVSEIIGSREIQEWGGLVKTVPFSKGYSTTKIIDKIKALS